MGDNKKFIKDVEVELCKRVTKLPCEELEAIALIRDTYLDERRKRFGDNPDFHKMTIREKIYPGMYMIPLLLADKVTTKRWDFWSEVLVTKDLSKDIPQIDFTANSYGENDCCKMLRNCIEYSRTSGALRFINFVNYVLYCLKPLHYHEGNTEEEKIANANKLINGIDDATLKFYYENFSLEGMLLYPSDYLGDLAADYLGSNGSAYFPTPHTVVHLMTELVMSDSKNSKFESMCDPCCGSSRMLLYASNHSLRVMGQDINKNIIDVSMVNGFLYVPWAVCSTEEISNMINSISNI